MAERIETSSGDVFIDLGFDDAGERKLRTQLAMRLNDLVAARKLTQSTVAALFGIPQPHVSELRHYKLNRFSSERFCCASSRCSTATWKSSSARRQKNMRRARCLCWPSPDWKKTVSFQ